MKRRNDSDGIARAERRETHGRKKVKFAGVEEEDNLSSEHPDFQGEESRDQNRHAASVPKTSEYAFFKKLQEERQRKSHLHPLPGKDDHTEKLRLTSRFHDSSAAGLLKDVIPAKVPSACLPAICVSRNSDYSKTSYKPGEIFSRARNILLSWVKRSSLPEIDELRSKGCELASLLLSRLTPKGTDALPLIGLLNSRLVSHTDEAESYKKRTWESIDVEEGKYLVDNALPSWLNKYNEGIASSYKPATVIAAASNHITCRGEADYAENLNAVSLDAAHNFSLNLATMEDGFIPLLGWKFEDGSWNSGRANSKGDSSMSLADWVLEVGESKRFSSDAWYDLETLPRLPSWTFDNLRQRENHGLDEGDNPFALSVVSAASPRLYPSALHAASSQDRDYMARLPPLLNAIQPPPSPASNYSFLAEDCSFPDWVLDELLSGKRHQLCPRPIVESFLISSRFNLRCLSPAGVARRNGTLTRSPYKVPLASIQDGESETLENGLETLENGLVGFDGDPASHFVGSPFCLYLEGSSRYFQSI